MIGRHSFTSFAAPLTTSLTSLDKGMGDMGLEFSTSRSATSSSSIMEMSLREGRLDRRQPATKVTRSAM